MRVTSTKLHRKDCEGVVDARITCVRGADGTIQHGIHRKGGAEISVLRLSGDG